MSELEKTYAFKSISKEVIDHVKETMKSDIKENIQRLNSELIMKNYDFISEKLEKGIAVTALSKLDLEKYRNALKALKKETYKFPSFLNAGELRNWHSTPSKIIGNEVYETFAPLILPFENTSIGFIQNQKYKDSITNMIETLAFKVLTSLPIGLTRLSIIDKTGSGQNFPNLIRLHDKFTGAKIMSDDITIEMELEDIKTSMSSITGSVTANGFTSIEDYNNNTNEIPQPYKILAISNFPLGFSKKAAESLISILESGYKAGIYVLMSYSVDMKHGKSQPIAGLQLNDFLNKMTVFEFLDKPHEYTRKGYMSKNIDLLSMPYSNETQIRELFNNDFKIIFEENEKTVFDSIVNELNSNIENVNIKPIIDIRKTLPNELWTDTAGKGVAIPFAKNGIEDIYLSLGKNQYGEEEGTHHGLIGGSTGSGKTVLLHDIILHGSLKYSPEELQFWLLDYKEGTEFAAYKDYPHVNILSMESEIEFGQEVLQNAIDEISRRGKLFKEVEASNLASYNSRVDKKNRLHRIIIIIDEFQALFPKNPKITARTNELINDILRRGRSFGFNLFLSTQTLTGIDMDPQLKSNMPLRIGLKMAKSDIPKLFDENNTAVRSLEDPGEGIYNKMFGNPVANVNFQAYLALNDAVDEVKSIVINKINSDIDPEKVKYLYDSRFVYSGKSPGNILSNKKLMKIINGEEKFDKSGFFIGELAGLTKDHVFIHFDNDYAENMLIAGQGISRVANLIYNSVRQLELQENTKIIINNFNKKSEKTFKALESEKTSIFSNRTFKDSINSIYEEFLQRKDMNESTLSKQEKIVYYVFFPEGSTDLNSSMRNRDSAVFKLKELISESSELGIHIVLYVTNINTLASFEMIRDIDKFKKKIGTGEGNYQKIFGDAADGITESISNNIMYAFDSDIKQEVFKFKDYEVIENVFK